MQIQINGKPSISANGRKAQVTIVTGEGRNRRSVTRHAVRRPGGWFGLNPDPRAIPLNERYQAELAEAKLVLADAKTALKNLQKKLENTEKVEPKPGLDEIMVDAAKTMLQGMVGEATLTVYTAEEIVDDAEAKLAMVHGDFPLEVEFVGDYL